MSSPQHEKQRLTDTRTVPRTDAANVLAHSAVLSERRGLKGLWFNANFAAVADVGEVDAEFFDG